MCIRDRPKKAQKALLHGKDYKVTVAYRNRFGRERRYTQGFEGVLGYIKRKHGETESDTARERYEEYMRNVPCPECNGARLNPAVLAVLVGGKSIAEVSEMALDEAYEFAANLELNEREAKIATEVLKEIRARLKFMLDVGLNYLNLSRASATLSGGEAQRLSLIHI